MSKVASGANLAPPVAAAVAAAVAATTPNQGIRTIDQFPQIGTATVPVSFIRENPVALRAVNRGSDKFQQIVDSVRSEGIINSINVRYKREGQGGIPDGRLYELLDGLHRYSAALEAGLADIPINILARTDDEALYTQIIGNVHKIDTKPGEYTRGLLRILASNPTMTQAELAAKLSVSPAFIEARLSLSKLDSKIMELVDQGHIPLTNAFPMARLPIDNQKDWVDRAMTMGAGEFGPLVNAEYKRLKEEKRKGNEGKPSIFEPQPHARKLGEIKAEYGNPEIGPLLLQKNNIKTLEQAWTLAVAWVLNMDPQSQEEARQRNAERERKAADEKARREAEKKAKKGSEAATRQAELTAAADKPPVVGSEAAEMLAAVT